MSVDPRGLEAARVAAGSVESWWAARPAVEAYANYLSVTLSQDLTAANERTNAAVDDYNTALAERDAAVEWIGVVRDELAAAGCPPGDRVVALASIRSVLATVTKLRAQLERAVEALDEKHSYYVEKAREYRDNPAKKERFNGLAVATHDARSLIQEIADAE